MRHRRVRAIHWILLGGAGALAFILFATWKASGRGLVQAPSPAREPDIPAPEMSEISSIAAPIKIPLSTLADELERLIAERRRPAGEERRGLQARGRPAAVAPEVVERIRRERTEGKSLAEIARRLTGDRVPTAHGGQRWWPSTVRSILLRRP